MILVFTAGIMWRDAGFACIDVLIRVEEEGGDMRRGVLLAALGIIAVLIACTNVQSAKEAPRISMEELKAKLGSPDLILVDVRTKKDWDMSSGKIIGAIRMDPDTFDDWAGTLAKDKEIVFYCA
jgi:predicted sulfurtransferase